jgi:hypothetical protein
MRGKERQVDKTSVETWASLIRVCKKEEGGSSLSIRRMRAIVAADELIRRYERELRRIHLHPEFAKEFSFDALRGALYAG